MTPAQHKATLETANAAIANGDIEGFLAHCTDDIQWSTVGEATLHGKPAVRKWMTTAYVEPPNFSVSRLVAEGDTVAALGDITTQDDHGATVHNAYCDVWRFRDGKMAELRAFVVETGRAPSR